MGSEMCIRDRLKLELSTPGERRLWYVAEALRNNWPIQEIYDSCRIDKWFIYQIKELVDLEIETSKKSIESLTRSELLNLKKKGFSDSRIAKLLETTELELREKRYELNIRPVFKRVDSCAAEFNSTTNYLYSTYEYENESVLSLSLIHI